VLWRLPIWSFIDGKPGNTTGNVKTSTASAANVLERRRLFRWLRLPSWQWPSPTRA
jgi:hypothetical protein